MILFFSEDNVAINVDRIDGIVPSVIENTTNIYSGGSLTPFRVKKSVHEVVEIINDALREVGESE